MPVDVTLDKTYKLKRRDIFLSLTIGEGQFGTSEVLLDDDTILRASGPIGQLRIGKGAELAGKTLTVFTVVNDVSSATNRMSVTYTLKGGQSTASFISKGTAPSNGDSLVFEANFSLEE